MFRQAIRLSLVVVILSILGNAAVPIANTEERVRAFTRLIEFDYASWTLDALAIKAKQAALGEARYLDSEAGSQLVRDYAALISQIEMDEAELNLLMASPELEEMTVQIINLNEKLENNYVRRQTDGPQAESVLQEQLAGILANYGLAFAGQAVPPVLYHSSPLPWALIVSPRDKIEQEANISLESELTLPEHIALEEAVSNSLNTSTLVVPVGGIGSYPTMVAQSSNLNWIAEVVAHEWVHNYLTLRPLGLLYERNQELRTMNETVANIAGKELGAALIQRYYPELAPIIPVSQDGESNPGQQKDIVDEPRFDFRAEMHTTRTRVDELLAAGEVEEAETYMETRRLFFWDHGFPIRKLNQAYYAFHGSYADQPIGPAGDDPVGEAVRALRERSDSLAAFIDTMAFITSLDELESKLE